MGQKCRFSGGKPRFYDTTMGCVLSQVKPVTANGGARAVAYGCIYTTLLVTIALGERQ